MTAISRAFATFAARDVAQQLFKRDFLPFDFAQDGEPVEPLLFEAPQE